MENKVDRLLLTRMLHRNILLSISTTGKSMLHVMHIQGDNMQDYAEWFVNKRNFLGHLRSAASFISLD